MREVLVMLFAPAVILYSYLSLIWSREIYCVENLNIDIYIQLCTTHLMQIFIDNFKGGTLLKINFKNLGGKVAAQLFLVFWHRLFLSLQTAKLLQLYTYYNHTTVVMLWPPDLESPLQIFSIKFQALSACFTCQLSSNILHLCSEHYLTVCVKIVADVCSDLL